MQISCSCFVKCAHCIFLFKLHYNYLYHLRLQIMAADGAQLGEVMGRERAQDMIYGSGYLGVLCAASKDTAVAHVLHKVVVVRHAALDRFAEGLARPWWAHLAS